MFFSEASLVVFCSIWAYFICGDVDKEEWVSGVWGHLFALCVYGGLYLFRSGNGRDADGFGIFGGYEGFLVALWGLVDLRSQGFCELSEVVYSGVVVLGSFVML